MKFAVGIDSLCSSKNIPIQIYCRYFKNSSLFLLQCLQRVQKDLLIVLLKGVNHISENDPQMYCLEDFLTDCVECGRRAWGQNFQRCSYNGIFIQSGKTVNDLVVFLETSLILIRCTDRECHLFRTFSWIGAL